ncbi:unnamed protein product [Adineta steineri]|uniref:EF-hand domain-containing protein n=1 Tax=Adineta steineri TaxID=433720 RepID=A0A819E9J6_9BILA|nr:unnamed protein product [Adineta steineri]CAF3846084.1 unnamed protein product [Adineta steineri]
MANFSYQSSNGGYGGGVDAAFQQADTDRDGRLNINEFRQFLGQSLNSAGGAGGAGGYSSGSSFESASYGNGAGAGYGAGAGAGYGAGSSSYESSSVQQSGYGAGGAASGYEAQFGAGGAAGGASQYESSQFASSGYGGEAGFAANQGGASFQSQQSSTQVQQYATDAQGLFQDPNPQIIRRPAAGGVQTYTQNIRVRFLQPPPIPPPGPLIIREVRPPQPPPPPPLRIRQQAPPLPQPPPLVLRERPPQVPASVASQTVIRRLAALPVPPRSVVIERLPPLPPRPRDVIIERWIPYGAQAKRRTIVQRAAAAQQYQRPRNVIIQYEPVQVRVVRQFQRLGVTQANPQAYVQQYGAQLLDAGTLLQQARSAGVVEDISPPAGAASAAVGFGAASYGQESQFAASSSQEAGFGGAAGFAGGASGFEAAGAGGYSQSSSFESAQFGANGGGAAGGYEAQFGAGGAQGGAGYGASSSSFESSSFQAGGGDAGFGGAAAGGFGAFGGADAAFAAADLNRDGNIDQNEFRQFISQNYGAGGAGGAAGGSSSYESSSFQSQSAGY